MRISLSPQRRDDALAVSKAGDVLTINGEAFDFSSLPDGGSIAAGTVPCDWILGTVDRVDGDLHLTLILPHGDAPEQWQAFPDAIVDPADGDTDLPVNTRVEVARQEVDGGVEVTTTIYRWHQAPEVTTRLIPTPKTETTDVDA